MCALILTVLEKKTLQYEFWILIYSFRMFFIQFLERSNHKNQHDEVETTDKSHNDINKQIIVVSELSGTVIYLSIFAVHNT